MHSHIRRLLAPLLSLAVTSSVVTSCGQDANEGPVNVYASQVVDGAQITVTIDDEPMRVVLAGIDAPVGAECMVEQFNAAIEALDGEDLTMTTVDAADSPRLVTLETSGGSDLATDLVADGLAVPQLKDGVVPREMENAATTAREAEAGFFDPAIPCTFAAEYAAAMEALQTASSNTAPRTIPGADGNIADLAAVLVAAKAVKEAIEVGGKSLRLTAYGPSRLATMAAHLSAEAASASRVLRANRTQRTLLVAEKRRREAEARRIAAEKARAAEAARAAAAAAARAAETDSYDPPSSNGGGGGGYEGYTGPRCYAPGGKSWKPC